VHILGTKVYNITLTQALKRAESFLHDTEQHYIVTPNPEIVLRARKDLAYRSILNSADLILPDGIGLLWASRKLHGPDKSIKERITGVDFLIKFLSHLSHGSNSPHRSLRVLLLGGRGGVARKAASNFTKRFPDMVFYSLENFENKNIDFVIRELMQPDLIFIGLGAPKQEEWIHQNLCKYPTVKIAMGVGGSFDMISGRLPRAPILLRDLSLEWLWRLTLEPGRFNRIFKAVILFPYVIHRLNR
jgi:N-acetylglucosaminyldiphosphoundecaprenol N-acetyl-beta-D-mannosaminyltransferase